MAMTKRPKRQYSSEIINLENMIPENHFLRIIEKYLIGTLYMKKLKNNILYLEDQV